MNKFKLVDLYVLIPYIVLSITGILMVYSASSYIAMADFSNPQHYLLRQSMYVLAGMITAVIGYLFPYKWLKEKKLVMIGTGVTVLLLFLVLLFAEEINGAKSWLSLGPINVQPAEIAKVIVIWYFAYILSLKQKNVVENLWKTIGAPAVLVGFICFLIFIQPDAGAAIILFGISAVMIFASGASPKIGVMFGAGGALLLTGLLELIRHYGDSLFFLQEYQYNRFLAFWDPFALSQSTGMQLVNSYYALSRGGLFGVGIGQSVQKTGYLPEPYTDFIISILGEELGLVGVLVVLGLFFFLISRIYLVGIRAKDPFGSLICIGIATMFLVQGCINLGGVIGLMPITGVTFPFISFGGSSTIVLAGSLGLVLNVSAHEKGHQLIRRKRQAHTAS